MYARRRRATGRVLLAPILICFALVLLAGEISKLDRAVAAPGQQEQLVGQTVRARLPTGDTVDTHFVSDTQVQWKVVDGPRQGQEGTDSAQVARIGPSQFFVNRIESATGDTVSEVYDTQLKRVWMYRTKLDPADVLNRHQAMQTARVELIPRGAAKP